MKPINPLARQHTAHLQGLAHVSTDGVRVAIMRSRWAVPECWGNGRVNLPVCLFDDDCPELLKSVWRHELQHARDLLDGVDLPREEMELRARRAERLP